MSTSERSRQELREWKKEYAEIEKKEQEERERPLRQAEAAYKDTSIKLAELRRDVILNDVDEGYRYGINPDEFAFMDLDTQKAFAVDNWTMFVRRYPEFNPTHRDNFENARKILETNRCILPTIHDWVWSFRKLQDGGLLIPLPAPIKIEPPAPAPQPNGYTLTDGNVSSKHYTMAEIDAMDSSTYQRLILRYEKDHPQRSQAVSKPDEMEGWDTETGERRTYTRWETDRMSSEQFHRAFRLKPEDRNLALHLRRP